MAQHGPQPCLGHREGGAFKYLSYAEAGEAVAALGGALVNVAGLQPHARVAIMGPNSPEWMLAMQVGGARGREGRRGFLRWGLGAARGKPWQALAAAVLIAALPAPCHHMLSRPATARLCTAYRSTTAWATTPWATSSSTAASGRG